jgi:hypothetical protein
MGATSACRVFGVVDIVQQKGIGSQDFLALDLKAKRKPQGKYKLTNDGSMLETLVDHVDPSFMEFGSRFRLLTQRPSCH